MTIEDGITIEEIKLRAAVELVNDDSWRSKAIMYLLRRIDESESCFDHDPSAPE
jgi:hypothetical protein